MEYKLDNIFDFIRNGTHIKQGIIDGGYPITRIETIANSYIDLNKMGYAGIEVLDKYENYLLKEGDILMSHINSEKHLGKTAIYENIDEDIIHGMNLLCLRPNKAKVIPKYINYYFNSVNFRIQLPNITKKSVNQASFSVSDLKKIKVCIPELETQVKIVEVLNKSQELIDKRKAQIEALDELVKSKFIEMFGNENTIFDKWETTEIGEIADVGVGVVIKPADYYTEANNGIKTFRSLNVGEMYIKDKDWVYFTKEGNEKNKKSILKEGQILIVRSGYPGTACVVTREYEGCNAIDVIISTPNISKINPTYMCAFTNYPHGKNQILEGQAGAAQKHFNVGAYKKMKIAVPPLDVQDEFLKFINQVNKLKFEMQKSLEEMENNFNSLMQRAFRGELFNEI